MIIIVLTASRYTLGIALSWNILDHLPCDYYCTYCEQVYTGHSTVLNDSGFSPLWLLYLLPACIHWGQHCPGTFWIISPAIIIVLTASRYTLGQHCPGTFWIFSPVIIIVLTASRYTLGTALSWNILDYLPCLTLGWHTWNFGTSYFTIITETQHTWLGIPLGVMLQTELNHICLVDSSFLASWMSPFVIQGVSGSL